MTQTRGPRPGQGTRSDSSNSYAQGTPGLEERDRILDALRESGHEPYTSSENDYYWFVPSCPAHPTAVVRVSKGRDIELTCQALGTEPCTRDEVIESLGLEHVIQTEKSTLDKLRAAVVDSHGLDEIPDPDPLIGDDVLFLDSLVWVVGKPGSMKSFVMLDMAGCIATGERWQGYAVTQGKVLILVAEGVRGTKMRVRAWEKAMGRRMDDVMFLPMAVQAGLQADWDALVELVREIHPVLVVLDTQARITVGMEENSNTEMGRFVAQAERLRLASGACVAIVHHIGRNGDTGRGATTLDGAMTTVIKVSKEEDRVTLECQKNKDGAEWDNIELRAVEMGDSIVLMLHDGLSRSQGNGPSLAALKLARTWWEHHAGNWVSASLLYEISSRSTFHRNVRELEKAGIVQVDHTGRHPRYRLDEQSGRSRWE